MFIKEKPEKRALAWIIEALTSFNLSFDLIAVDHAHIDASISLLSEASIDRCLVD